MFARTAGDIQPDITGHYGPYLADAYVSEFASISDRAFQKFWAAGPPKKRFFPKKPKVNLVVAMMHIAQITSTAVRLNATWNLGHAALSLARDRYEQTVRFSWIALQPNEDELLKYLTAYYAKANKVVRSYTPEQFDSFVGETKPEPWMLRDLTKEEREWANSWEKLDLLSMVKKRDSMLPSSGPKLSRQPLAHWYGPFYRELSSVAHYDMFGIMLLQMHRTTETSFVLTTDLKLPASLVSMVALFDVIQCYEATSSFFDRRIADEEFDALYREWRAYVKLLAPSLRGHLLPKVR
jgi:hypothetical protein